LGDEVRRTLSNIKQRILRAMGQPEISVEEIRGMGIITPRRLVKGGEIMKVAADFNDEDWKFVFEKYIREEGDADVEFFEDFAKVSVRGSRFTWRRYQIDGVGLFNYWLRKFGLEVTEINVSPSLVPFRLNIEAVVAPKFHKGVGNKTNDMTPFGKHYQPTEFRRGEDDE